MGSNVGDKRNDRQVSQRLHLLTKNIRPCRLPGIAEQSDEVRVFTQCCLLGMLRRWVDGDGERLADGCPRLGVKFARVSLRKGGDRSEPWAGKWAKAVAKGSGLEKRVSPVARASDDQGCDDREEGVSGRGCRFAGKKKPSFRSRRKDGLIELDQYSLGGRITLAVKWKLISSSGKSVNVSRFLWIRRSLTSVHVRIAV